MYNDGYSHSNINYFVDALISRDEDEAALDVFESHGAVPNGTSPNPGNPLPPPPGGDDSSFNLTSMQAAFVQTFVLMFIGYFSVRIGFVPHSLTRALSVVVTKFTLPALIFLALGEAHMGKTMGDFVLGVLVSKMLVFIGVVVVTFIASGNSLGWTSTAGIRGIFVTQSNDFAVALPILSSLFKDPHSNYIQMIYVVAPLQLLLINSLGYILIENGKASTDINYFSTGADRSKLYRYWAVFASLAQNPITVMTVAGLLCNLIFNGHLPRIFTTILQPLSDAYIATALLTLGMSLSGRVGGLSIDKFMLPLILSGVKIVILPAIMRPVVSMIAGSRDLAVFSFLYGMAPTAPSVYYYSHYYDIEPEIIAPATVLCTILSAPVLYLSAEVVAMGYGDSSRPGVVSTLVNSLTGISEASFLCIVLLSLLFFVAQKRTKYPYYRYLPYILSVQAALSITVTIREFAKLSYTVMEFRQAFEFFFLQLTRYFTMVVFVHMVYMHSTGHIHLPRWGEFLVHGIAWIILPAVTVILGVTGSFRYNCDSEIDPIYCWPYRVSSPATHISMAFMCLLVGTVGGSLIWLRRISSRARSPGGRPDYGIYFRRDSTTLPGSVTSVNQVTDGDNITTDGVVNPALLAQSMEVERDSEEGSEDEEWNNYNVRVSLQQTPYDETYYRNTIWGLYMMMLSLCEVSLDTYTLYLSSDALIMIEFKYLVGALHYGAGIVALLIFGLGPRVLNPARSLMSWIRNPRGNPVNLLDDIRSGERDGLDSDAVIADEWTSLPVEGMDGEIAPATYSNLFERQYDGTMGLRRSDLRGSSG
eukprot:Clim_evm25s155 gene=Clim_evmTU25s155